MNTWKQISGDVTASQYGAMFGQLDTLGDKVSGVYVAEIVNMPDACGSDWDSQAQGGDYLTQVSWVDVDGMELRKMRDILASCGWARRIDDDNAPEYPEATSERMAWINAHVADMRKLQAWERRAWTAGEMAHVDALRDEYETYRRWFSIPRMARAEMAVRYGGYSDGQSLTFRTLAEAMDYHHIPASALWLPSEYNAVLETAEA